MPTLQIPLNTGLVTQVDGEEVSINACTELINAEFDKPGVIYKRKGSAGGVDTNKTFVSITRWYNPNIADDYYWIGIDSSDNVWYSTNLTSWTEITFTPAITDDTEIVKVVNYNTQLRFPCGITDDARIYQYIDRDFFWSAVEGTPAFYTDIARPRDIVDALVTQKYVSTTHIFMKDGSDLLFTGTNLSDINYYYKYALVFDGNQESSLSPLIDDTTAGTGTVIPSEVIGFDTGSSLADWNRRITGINMYRATSFDGNYYQVGAFSTKSDDGGLTKVTDVVKDVGVHVPGVTYSSNQYASDKLVNRGTFANIASNTTDILTLSAVLKDTNDTLPSLATDAWGSTDMVISDSVLYAHTCDNNTGITSAGTLTVDTAEKKWGSASLRETGTSCLFLTASITLPSATSLTVEWWGWVNDNGSGGNKTWQITVIDDASGIANYAVPDGNLTPSGIGGPYAVWQKYKAVFTLASGWNGLTVKFRIGAGLGSAVASDYMRIDGISVYKTSSVTPTGYGGFGGAYTSESLSLGAADSHRGFVYQRGSGGLSADERGFILKNSQKAIQVATTGDVPYNEGASGTNLFIAQNYLWLRDSNEQLFVFYDIATDGVIHPTGDTSLDVKHRHSKYINGRNYVADVRITNNTETEDHDNWVMFSELNQPDVIPITNYIQLTDAQGGKIVGIESLMGDLAVLMEHGIFRLSIPSADPAQWSLSESEENIGCVSDNSITVWESGLFFAGKDHLYYLDVNFNAIAMTASIKDDYQGAVTSSARTFYDVKKNRLLC